jgi:hypothetical protein
MPLWSARVEGQHSVYARKADSGFENRFHFCPTCGSNVFWEGDRAPDYCGVTVGCFADPEFPAPTISIYEEAMHSWFSPPDGVEHLAGGFPMAPPPDTNQR